MKVQNGSRVVLSVDDLKALVTKHVEQLKPDYQVEYVEFDVRGHNAPDDWRSAESLNYQLEEVRITMKRRE